MKKLILALLFLSVSAIASYNPPPSNIDSSLDMKNVGIVATVAANALTIALKGKDLNDPSATNAVYIGFRHATQATGSYTVGSATAATSLVISSGSTLGCSNAVICHISVFAINNLGTIELAAIGTTGTDEGVLVTTTAEGGGGGATSKSTLYSTTARTSIPGRLIARIRADQTTAGTWAAAPTRIETLPFRQGFYNCTAFIDHSGGTPTLTRSDLNCATGVTDNASGDTTVTLAGIPTITPNCTCTSYKDFATNATGCQVSAGSAISPTSVRVVTWSGATGLADDTASFFLSCGEQP